MPTPVYTTLHQDSSTVYDANGNPKFRITSSITEVRPGDLPDDQPEVFVYQIVDATDPKQDKFLRVATIHDLSKVTRGRDPARVAGQTFFLGSSFTVDYNDVTTAINAKAVIQTRVDALISDWIDYSTKFLVPTDFTMPAPEDTLVTAAKNSYYTAKAANTAKQAELATAVTAFTDAKADATRAGDDLTKALAQSTACTELKSKLSTFTAEYSTLSAPLNYRSSMNGLMDAVTAAGANPIYDAAKTVADAARSRETTVISPLLTNINATVEAQCATLAAAVQVAAQAKSTADAAAAAAQTTQALAQGAADAAAAGEAAALTAVLAICPDFDPNA